MKMKYLIYEFVLLFCFQGQLFCQAIDWAKADRAVLYENCMESDRIIGLSNENQQESICLCFLDELTKKYSKKEYSMKIEIETERIQLAIQTQCATNMGLELNKTLAKTGQKEVIISNKTTSTPKQKEDFKPSQLNLLGHWRDENSDFWIKESGDYIIVFDMGLIEEGKWYLTGNRFLTNGEYKILSQESDVFVYQSIEGGNQTFKAERINDRDLSSITKNDMFASWKFVNGGMFNGGTFSFYPDGEYKYKDAMGLICRGNWYLSEGKLLIKGKGLCSTEEFEIIAFENNTIFVKYQLSAKKYNVFRLKQVE